jgi:hypothetical protein
MTTATTTTMIAISPPLDRLKDPSSGPEAPAAFPLSDEGWFEEPVSADNMYDGTDTAGVDVADF